MKVQVKRKPRETADIPVRTEFIRLDAFLKLCGAAESGGQAKADIQAGHVRVGGEVCLQRGKKLRPGDEVLHTGKIYRVTAAREE